MRETRLDTSFLDDALDFVSREAQHAVVDSLACHLHNDGYQLQGNTEANDVEWFARNIHQRRPGGGLPGDWDHISEAERESYRAVSRAVIDALPAFQLRVAHRLITLSKVTRDIERALRRPSRG
ncbi:MAG TPA: hypothetical protein VH539_20485 [Gemmatimonadaceae bacterium]|jgi:hypothetical protein